MSGESDDSAVAPSDEVSEWLSLLDEARREDGMERYEERCKTIRAKYRYEGSALVRTRKYQMLWSNIQTMQSAIYAKPPHAVVSRRFRDQDPIARTATEILERAVNFTFDAADFDTEFKMVRDDFLLYARGVARIYYEPEYETEDDSNEDIEDAEDIRSPTGDQASSYGYGVRRSDTEGTGGLGSGETGYDRGGISLDKGDDDFDKDDGKREPKLKFENVRIRFVQRADFRHQPARVWAECQWVAFRAFMTRDEIIGRFGKKVGKEISLDAEPMSADDAGREDGHSSNARLRKAAIWEIWDKAKTRVLWISPGYPNVLESGDPYLDLDGFYPCPRPAYGTLTPDSLVPVPDFVFYQDQAAEIDQLTARIGGLSDALKLVGFYPAGPQGEGSPEIEKAMQPGFENKMIAVQSWSTFLEGGQGKQAPIVWLPVDQVVEIVKACIELRKQLVEDVYQIIGISDIMRGATDPQETEGAQQLKAQYGGVRIKDRQAEIARFCRDISRLVGQVIAQYCSPATIMEMTNVKLPTRAEVMMAQLIAAARQAQMNPQGAGQAQGLGAPNPTTPLVGPQATHGLGVPAPMGMGR
jgi:hypothetical protein